MTALICRGQCEHVPSYALRGVVKNSEDWLEKERKGKVRNREDGVRNGEERRVLRRKIWRVYGKDVGTATRGTGTESSGEGVESFEEGIEADMAENKVRVVKTCDTTQRYIILQHVKCLD